MKASKKKTLSIVIPVFNEKKILDELRRQLGSVLEGIGLDFEILFVNDGSSDGSAAVLDDMAADDARTRVIHLSRNFGQQAALHAGLTRARGDACVVMDCDLQDDPRVIRRFVEEWENGFHVVYAIRSKRKEGLIKRFLFRLFYRTFKLMFPVNVPLDAGNFSLIDRRVVDEILGFSDCHRFLPGLRAWAGFKQKGVITERSVRYDDNPRVSILGLINLAKDAFFSFSNFPLTVFYLITFVCWLIVVLLTAFLLYHKFITHLAIPGWTSTIMTICFFGGMNSLGIAILGEYVWRIYNQVLRRPVYIIAKETG